MRNDFAQPFSVGIVTALVGFTSSFAVVLAGLREVGADTAQAPSGLGLLCLLQGLGMVWLTWRHRTPLTLAWSTPGAALLATQGYVKGGGCARRRRAAGRSAPDLHVAGLYVGGDPEARAATVRSDDGLAERAGRRELHRPLDEDDTGPRHHNDGGGRVGRDGAGRRIHILGRSRTGWARGR